MSTSRSGNPGATQDILSEALDLFGAQTQKIKSKADVSAETLQKIKAEVESAVKGEGGVDTAALRRKLERKHQEEIHKFVWPGSGDVPGRQLLKVVLRQSNGAEPVRLYWDYLPHPTPCLLCICPSCYLLAPTHINTKQATQPTIVDGFLGRIQGNPEADKKLVPFSLNYPTFHIFVDAKKHLTVRETIRCPRSKECGFIVRVEDGIATKVSGRITRGGGTGKGGIKGPLIIVK